MSILDKCKVTFKLEQLTPMLHFQHNEQGATVRASEMKPKLDRFLIDWFGEEYCKDWIQKDSDSKEDKLPSLKYKLNIIAQNPVKLDAMDSSFAETQAFRFPGGYFGDLNNIQPVKHREILVEITCFDENLRTQIKELYPIFIAANNFGTRQRMGYGCFKVVNVDGSTYTAKREDLLKKYVAKMQQTGKNILLYRIGYVKYRTDADGLKIISDFHQHLKSGVNRSEYDERTGSYRRSPRNYYDPSSLMKGYMGDKMNGHINEKKAMKAYLAKQRGVYNIEKLCFKANGGEPKVVSLERASLDGVWYLRGLFGFAGQYEFRQIYRKDKEREILRDRNGNPTSSVRFSLEAGEVERFPSPITYFPNGDNIYFMVRVDYIATLIEKNPNIRVSEKDEWKTLDRKTKSIKKEDVFEMKLPQSFDVKGFFDYLCRSNIPCRVYNVQNRESVPNYDLRLIRINN